MNFNIPIILENDRVRLEPLKREHFELLLPFSIQEPELWIHSLTPADGEENLKSYIDMALIAKERKDSYPFLVYDKLTQEYAGSTRFYDFQEKHLTVQLGYTWYGQKFQRTGVNKNCKFLLLEYAFEKCDLERVEFRADATNKQSITAMISLGCTVEGILRSNCTSETGRRDSIVLSILKNEWTNEVKESLMRRILEY